jgi:hypothetical protein
LAIIAIAFGLGSAPFLGGSLFWALAAVAGLVLMSAFLIHQQLRATRRDPFVILRVDAAARSLVLERCAVQILLTEVRDVQLLAGTADPADWGQSMHQIVVVTKSTEQGWARHLAYVDFGDASPNAMRAVVRFSKLIGVEGTCWTVRGWRTPPVELFDRRPDRAATRRGLFAPCVEPLDRAARDRAGLNDYDAYAEPLLPLVAKNLCLACGYSLEGLTTDTCPECGTNFMAKPDARG